MCQTFTRGSLLSDEIQNETLKGHCWEGGNESSGGKLEVENESSEEKMRGAIENEILEFSTMRIWLKLRIHFCVTICIESIRIAMNCEKIDNQILLNLDFSKFQEFDNHTLEWKLSQHNWESRWRKRREFYLRVSISRSRLESRTSLVCVWDSEQSLLVTVL